MKKTRVELFAEYREKISKIPASEEIDNESSEEIIEEKEDDVLKQTLSHSMEEIMQKRDEYTIMMDADELAEKKALEEKKSKQERKKKILYVSLLGALALAAIAIIIILIVVLASN